MVRLFGADALRQRLFVRCRPVDPPTAATLAEIPGVAAVEQEGLRRDACVDLDSIDRISLRMEAGADPAAVGLVNAMTIAALGRTREFGVLAALGLSRAGTLSILAVEAAVVGVLAGAVPLLLAVPTSWVVVRGLSTVSGLDVPWVLPAGWILAFPPWPSPRRCSPASCRPCASPASPPPRRYATNEWHG